MYQRKTRQMLVPLPPQDISLVERPNENGSRFLPALYFFLSIKTKSELCHTKMVTLHSNITKPDEWVNGLFGFFKIITI